MSAVKQTSSLSSLSSTVKAASTLDSLMPYSPKPNPLRVAEYSDLYAQSMADRGALKQKRKVKKRTYVTANLSGTRYAVVRKVASQMGFVITKEDDFDSNLIWNDSFATLERISEMKSYQRINHFPGMGEITKKDTLARNIIKLQKIHPEEFNFIPKTWIMPADFASFMNYAKDVKMKKKQSVFISKPSNGAQGHGISLHKNIDKIPISDHAITQEYIQKPLLIDGYKFDLRLYVLITSCDPLRVFFFNDGLVRLSTEKYQLPQDSNLNNLFMHLTNYSINKHNERYEKGATSNCGSKRSLQFLDTYLRENDYDVGLLWRRIYDLIVKTMIVGAPHLLHSYRMCRPGALPGSNSVCFEILGFDIIIDRKLWPWLLEVNRSPSLGTDQKVDYDIKSNLVTDTLRLLHIRSCDKKRNYAAQKAETQKRLFCNTKKIHLKGFGVEQFRKTRLIEKKREELKGLLTKIRKNASQEDFENRNCGTFRRVFPADDRIRQEKFTNLLLSSFSQFTSGRASVHKDIQDTYNCKLTEEDVLDMLAECEADENDQCVKASREPKPLQGMPESLPRTPPDSEIEDEDVENYAEQNENFFRSQFANHEIASLYFPKSHARLNQSASCVDSKAEEELLSCHLYAKDTKPPKSILLPQSRKLTSRRSKSLSRITSAKTEQKFSPLLVDNHQLEQEQKFLQQTLTALKEMRIKFPGKCDDEAKKVINKLYDNWKFHKPRIASYWLVKLDSVKRRKVIDIVKSNVKLLLQKIWQICNVEILRLYHIFSKVFNRLLWSHGQGLWNSFSKPGNSWEVMLKKSTEVVTELELNCCRQIVKLCQDCLLIVYQFGTEVKPTSLKMKADEKVSYRLSAYWGLRQCMDQTAKKSNGCLFLPPKKIAWKIFEQAIVHEEISKIKKSV